jgi:hypothetical protein
VIQGFTAFKNPVEPVLIFVLLTSLAIFYGLGFLFIMIRFLISVYSENKSKVTISQTKANQLAYNIYNAKSFYNDDEEEAVGAIKLAGTKINVSYVAFRFYQLYQRDLQSYLESFLESDNWSDLNEALDKMKNF